VAAESKGSTTMPMQKLVIRHNPLIYLTTYFLTILLSSSQNSTVSQDISLLKFSGQIAPFKVSHSSVSPKPSVITPLLDIPFTAKLHVFLVQHVYCTFGSICSLHKVLKRKTQLKTVYACPHVTSL
jgi:hypothetical protein